MKTDTPRTDEAASDGWSGDAICVSADFARELERENAAIKRKIDEWHSASDAELRLRMGELSAQDIRNIRAVLSAIHQVS